MIEVGEFREGMPLSELIQLAVNDARRAVATGKYVLDGHYWHTPRADRCAICLGGGILAGLVGFNPHHLAGEFSTQDRNLECWETDAILALDNVRGGYIEDALDNLGADFFAVHKSAIAAARNLIADEFPCHGAIAPLETYEAAAQILAEVGL